MKGKKILIVDDDVSICKVLALALEQMGAETMSVHNGRQGIERFMEWDPDMVILDVRMPEVDGWEVCRQIRLLSNKPIIMLTTLRGDQEMIHGLEEGADDYLSKPFNIDVLIARAQALFRRTDSRPLS